MLSRLSTLLLLTLALLVVSRVPSTWADEAVLRDAIQSRTLSVAAAAAREILETQEPRERISLLEFAMRSGSLHAREILLREGFTPALYTAWRGAAAEVAKALSALEPDLRRAAVVAVANLPSSEAVPLLVSALRDEDEFVRFQAAQRLPAGFARATLEELVASDLTTDWVRREARERLRELNEKRHVPHCGQFAHLRRR